MARRSASGQVGAFGFALQAVNDLPDAERQADHLQLEAVLLLLNEALEVQRDSTGQKAITTLPCTN